jgi:hypothetical protein
VYTFVGLKAQEGESILAAVARPGAVLDHASEVTDDVLVAGYR